MPIEVHIEDDHVRVPLGDRWLNVGRVFDGMRGVHAVVERQLDELNEDRSIEQEQDARRPTYGPTGRLILPTLRYGRVSHEVSKLYRQQLHVRCQMTCNR